jgi:hypothetical protein
MMDSGEKDRGRPDSEGVDLQEVVALQEWMGLQE